MGVVSVACCWLGWAGHTPTSHPETPPRRLHCCRLLKSSHWLAQKGRPHHQVGQKAVYSGRLEASWQCPHYMVVFDLNWPSVSWQWPWPISAQWPWMFLSLHGMSLTIGRNKLEKLLLSTLWPWCQQCNRCGRPGQLSQIAFSHFPALNMCIFYSDNFAARVNLKEFPSEIWRLVVP